MNRNVIIAILVVIIIAAGAAFIFSQNAKTNTQLTIVNNETFQNGEELQVVLKDAQGNAISGQTVNITFDNEKYSVVTDQNGKGYLLFGGETAGQYDVNATYSGNDKYEGCSAKVTVTITDDQPDNLATKTSGDNVASSSGGNSPSNSGLNYDSQYGVYYDGNGKIHAPGQQYDGMNINDYRNWINSPDKFIDDMEKQYNQTHSNSTG